MDSGSSRDRFLLGALLGVGKWGVIRHCHSLQWFREQWCGRIQQSLTHSLKHQAKNKPGSSIVHNNSNLETIHSSISWWRDKHTVKRPAQQQKGADWTDNATAWIKLKNITLSDRRWIPKATKSQMDSYESIYRTFLTFLERQHYRDSKQIRLLGAGDRNRDWLQTDTGEFGGWWSVFRGLWWWLHSYINWQILHRWIVKCRDCFSMKLLKRERRKAKKTQSNIFSQPYCSAPFS